MAWVWGRPAWARKGVEDMRDRALSLAPVHYPSPPARGFETQAGHSLPRRVSFFALVTWHPMSGCSRVNWRSRGLRKAEGGEKACPKHLLPFGLIVLMSAQKG